MISLWLKLAYTLHVCVLVPVYWVELGPQNFLWGCDIALLVTLVALWAESRFLASMMAVAIVLPEIIWNLDFFSRLIAGHDVIGLDLTAHMFAPEKPLFLRGLSLFHVFLPMVLLWLLYRLGYDQRAVWATTILAWIVLPASYWLTDPERNINFVFSISSTSLDWVPGFINVIVLMVLMPLLFYLPTHLISKRLFPGANDLQSTDTSV